MGCPAAWRGSPSRGTNTSMESAVWSLALASLQSYPWNWQGGFQPQVLGLAWPASAVVREHCPPSIAPPLQRALDSVLMQAVLVLHDD